MILNMVGKLAPISPHFTRGLVKYVPGMGYFRAVPSQNGDKFATSPTPPIFERLRIVFLLLTESTWAGGLDWTEGVAVRASAIHCASPRHPTSTGGDGTRGGRPPFSILHSRTDHRQGQQLRAEGNITNNETICLYQWLLPPSTLNLFLPCQM